MRRFPQLHEDALPVPKGLQPKPGVEYGCGNAACRDCYEPLLSAQRGSIENPAR